MRVDGLIFANEKLLEAIRKDQAPDQVANVATLPGIQVASLAMPDIHWGYGFCIGGVCATDPDEGGVISPGGVGYDINCGVRLVQTNLFHRDVKPHLRELVEGAVPHRPDRRRQARASTSSTARRLRRLMGEGPRFVIDRDLGVPRDLDHTEAQRPHRRRRPGRGVATTPSSAAPSSAARSAPATTSSKCRSSMHVFDADVAKVVRPGEGPGLRDDPLRQPRPRLPGVRRRPRRSSATPRRSTASTCPTGSSPAPRSISPEGQKYIAAMRAAANFGFCNRQLLMQQAREVFADGLRPVVAGPRHGPALRRVPQHRQARGAHRRRQEEEGLGPPQGGDAGLPGRAPGGAGGVPRGRPAGHHPRRHGPGELGAGRRSRAAWRRRSARPATGPAGR